MNAEEKEMITKASDEMLARYIIKNLASYDHENALDGDVGYLAEMLGEHRRQCAARPEVATSYPSFKLPVRYVEEPHEGGEWQDADGKPVLAEAIEEAINRYATLKPEERALKEARTLLAEAKEVLGRYWFHGTDDGESYNNDDVIEIDNRIEAFLKGGG